MKNRFLSCTVLCMALVSLSSTSAGAQSSEPAEIPPLRADVFFSLGYGTLSGGSSEGGAWGPGSAGVGLEYRLSERGALRVEGFVLNGQAKLGTTGLLELETMVTVNQTGLGVGYRWYGLSGQYLGAGATLSRVHMCDVDTEGGPGFFGGETVSCKDFTDTPLSPAKNVAGLAATGGVTRGALAYGVRIDAGLQPSVDSPEGPMRLLNVGIMVTYRFRSGRGSTPTTPSSAESGAVRP